ncbi:MAG: ThuA domain-containing protein, partial [Pirellulales bacterium]
PHGYVGTPTAIARSTMLLPDVVVSPAGDLYITCHSGPPDWGTGPEGAGKLFRIRLADRNVAQPVLAYTTSPLEVRIAFDRPVDPKMLEGLASQQIDYGKFVRAADNLEVLKPPYQAVKEQEKRQPGKLRITAAKLTPGGRTVALRTDPHPVPGTYALAVNSQADIATGAPSEAVFLDYDLSGTQATWTSVGAQKPLWSGWLPHVDLDVVRSLIAKSHDHAKLMGLLWNPGKLDFHGKIQLPEGSVTLRLQSSAPCELQVGDASATSANNDERNQICEVIVNSTAEPIGFNATLLTGTKVPELHLSYHTAVDPTERVVELQRLSVPWSPPAMTVVEDEKTAESVQVTGDARRGEAIFSGQVAKCSACHAIHGRGPKLGPDLSQLVHRDLASILRDIREPSAMINPDYVSYTLILNDGRTASGVLRAEGADSVRLANSEAQETVIPLDSIEDMQPQPISMMPKHLLDTLSEAEAQDLLAYLVTPLRPPHELVSHARTRAELESILHAATPPSEPVETKPLAVMLVAGKQDHGPGEHDYPAWQQSWTKLLKKAGKLTVDTAQDWPNAEQWKRSDVIVFYFWNHDWSPDRYRDLDAFLARGGGVVAIHSALIADSNPEKLAERWGLAAQPRRTKYRHGPLELVFDSQADHTITAGFTNAPMVDETYWPMIGDPSRVRVLATTIEDGQSRPMLWTYQPGKGRVFASVLGHYAKTLDDPWFQILMLRGVAWAADEPITRLQGTAVEGL